MQVGIHLPQIGPIAGPETIRRAAEQAEALGFADVWVSDHVVVPNGAPYPPTPYFLDPILALTWAAAFTSRVRLGTSVLVLPMRHPLPVAKQLGSLQNLAQGGLILGAGVGWMEAEYAALGVPFKERGKRMDEAIAMMRACWTEDPVSFPSQVWDAEINDMRMLPQPCEPIPIWIGGSSDAAIRRAARCDGWHGSRASPEQTAPLVAQLREMRPEPEFTISVRTSWNGMDDGELRWRMEGYKAVGVQHLMIEPYAGTLDDWLGMAERIAQAGAGLADE